MASIIFMLSYLFYLLYFSFSFNPYLIPIWIVICFAMAFVTMLFIYLLHLPIVWILPAKHRYKAYMLRSMAIFLNMFILRLKVTVEGLENIPLDSPLVVYSNHKSYTDAFSILEFFPRPLTLTPKKSVMKIPIVNLWLKSYDVFPINRSNHRETAKDLDKAIQTVKNGHAILLFPEGSIGDRLKDQVNTMKAGSFKLALKSGANILVVKLEGNDLVRRRAPFKISYRKVVIKPLIMHESIANMSTQEIANLVMDTINK